MQLLVVRHAVAEDAALGQSDGARELTVEGERKFRRVVRGLRELGWRLDGVLTSPWARAARTAELLAPINDGAAPIATELLCEAPRTDLIALIASVPTVAKKRRATAVVGHEPWLSELIAWLAFGDARHGEGFELKKGAVAWLEGSAVPGGMTIRAIMPPSVLRELA
jgi:phosphohistidine phosphatase